MEFVGDYLKEIRLSKKLKIKDISRELNIGENIIRSIEKDDFPNYINIVFLIGHIRAYSKYLDLNHNEIVEHFKIQISYNDVKFKKEISKPIIIEKFFSFSKVLSFSSIVIITSTFYLLFIKPNNTELNYAMTPDVPENLKHKLEQIEMNIAMEKDKNFESDDTISEINKNIFLTNDNESKIKTSSSVIASLPNKQIDNGLKDNITLKFTNPTWIQLRDSDDNIVFSKLMSQKDEYTYNMSKKLYLTSGNAGNIIVLFNNEVMGRAGKAGEVLDSLFIDNNFNN